MIDSFAQIQLYYAMYSKLGSAKPSFDIESGIPGGFQNRLMTSTNPYKVTFYPAFSNLSKNTPNEK